MIRLGQGLPCAAGERRARSCLPRQRRDGCGETRGGEARITV